MKVLSRMKLNSSCNTHAKFNPQNVEEFDLSISISIPKSNHGG